VAVNSADFPVDARKGSLLMVTPEEQAHAILLTVADDVRWGAKNHKQWRLVLLSVPVFIDVIPKEEQVQWEAHNARQLIAGTLDYGTNSAATMLRGGSCQEHIAENIGSGADKEGYQ
jgi:hypothetical protein